MARSSLFRRVQAIEGQRDRALAQQTEAALQRIASHPVDLALQLCILQSLVAGYSADDMPTSITKLKTEFDQYLDQMIEEDRNQVFQIVDEYQSAATAGQKAISAVTDKHSKDKNDD